MQKKGSLMKRLFDVFISGLLLIVAAPFMLLIALAIKLDSSGNILYKQERVGLYSKLFKMYKFRSMVSNADKIGDYFTMPGDIRVTKIGAFLRKSSLDELPQLFNVLKGDMSLVGPRPDVAAQRDYYTDQEWRLRHTLRPGITGLAQATVRSETTMEERKALDLEYISKSSLVYDLIIILKTAKQIIFKGSY